MAGGGIPLDKAELLAILLESVFYGIFLTLFCVTLYVLLSRPNGSFSGSRQLVATAIILMILATCHIVLDFFRIIEAFITKRSTKGGPIAYYDNLANPLHLVKTAIYVTQTLTGDSLAAWRCYVVHRRNKLVIIVPILLLFGCGVTGCVGIWNVSRVPPGRSVFSTSQAWITSFFSITLAMNSYCTVLIGYNIWSSNSVARNQGQYDLTPVLLAVVESGALYSAALFALLVTYLAGSNGQYPALDIVTPLVGIVFSLIIIQVRVYVVKRDSTPITQLSKTFSGRRATHAFPLDDVGVEITQTRHVDYDGAISPSDNRSLKHPDDTWHAI